MVNRSLIERSTSKRYRLHPLIRLFTQKKIPRPGLYLETASYYEKFLEKGGRGNIKFYPFIEIEIDNILSIFNKCYELKLFESIIKLWEYIGVFLWDTGHWNLVDKLGQKTYRGTVKSKNDYARALCCIRELSWLHYWRGNLPTAVKWSDDGLRIAKKLKNDYLIAYAKQRLGKIYQSRNKNKKAERLLKEAKEIFTKLKEFERLGDTLTYLGEQYVLIGDLRRAKQYLERALILTSKINDINQNAIVLGYLGEINYLKKNYKKARNCFEESLSVTHTKGMNVGGKVWCNIGLALLEYRLGNFKEAYRLSQLAQDNKLRLGIWYHDSRPLMIEYRRLLNKFLPSLIP